jgi:GNAT superfamily N-acetyltransferase
VNSRVDVLDIRVAGSERLTDLAGVFGRAFVTEPAFAWALSGPNLEARMIRAFELYLARVIPLGVVWEAGDGLGAMVLVSDDRMADWEAAVVDDSLIGDLADDGGARHVAYWTWISSKLPQERVWQLDSVAVDSSARGRGIASALIRHGLARASDAGFATTLETGTAANVPIYEHLGFTVVDEADGPDGAPHTWFMRREPSLPPRARD